MSEDKIQIQDDGKNGSRRSRKDDQGRDYVCGCGKKYLSYPALYTHIKTKHQGHQPQGTLKTGTINKRQKQKIDQKLLKQIQSWVQPQDVGVIKVLDQNAIGTVSPSQRMRRDCVGKQIYQAYVSLIKNISIELTQQSSIETALIVYLLGAGKYVSESLYSYYTMFAKLFRNCYHQHLEEVFQACFKDHAEKVGKVSVLQCKLANIICDFFIRFYVPTQIKDLSDDLKCLLQLILFDFCKWLDNKKLSIFQVTLKQEYKMTRKNFIETKKKRENNRAKKQYKGQNQGDHDHQNEGEAQENGQENEGQNNHQNSEQQQIKQKIDKVESEYQPENNSKCEVQKQKKQMQEQNEQKLQKISQNIQKDEKVVNKNNQRPSQQQNVQDNIQENHEKSQQIQIEQNDKQQNNHHENQDHKKDGDQNVQIQVNKNPQEIQVEDKVVGDYKKDEQIQQKVNQQQIHEAQVNQAANKTENREVLSQNNNNMQLQEAQN